MVAIGIFENLLAVYRIGLMTDRVKGTSDLNRWFCTNWKALGGQIIGHCFRVNASGFHANVVIGFINVVPFQP